MSIASATLALPQTLLSLTSPPDPAPSFGLQAKAGAQHMYTCWVFSLGLDAGDELRYHSWAFTPIFLWTSHGPLANPTSKPTCRTSARV